MIRIYDGSGALLSERFGTSFLQATASGTYFASAGTSGEAVGDYRLSARRLELPDDIPGDAGTGAELALDGEAASTVDFPGDENWDRVELSAGQLYRFDVRPDDGAGNPLGGPAVRLYDGTGALIAEQGGTLFHEAQATGTFFASAGGFGDTVGDYRLTAELVDLSDDVAGDPSTSATLRAGRRVAGAADFPGDENWYRVELRAGELYRFDLQTNEWSGDPLANPALRLYDAEGALLDEQSQTLLFSPPRSGTFFASAAAFDGAVGDYRLRLRDIDLATEIRGDVATTSVIELGRERSGKIDFPFDQDWFRVSLTAGTNYRLELRTDEGARNPLPDAYLRLFNAGGELIAEDDDGGGDLNSFLIFEAFSTGTFFASAGGFGESEGRYVLRVSPVDPAGLPLVALEPVASPVDTVFG